MDGGKKIGIAAKQFVRDVVIIILMGAFFGLIDLVVEHFVSGDLARPGLGNEMAEALAQFHPLNLLSGTVGTDVDVRNTPQFAACLAAKNPEYEAQRETCKSGLTCALIPQSADDFCTKDLQDRLRRPSSGNFLRDLGSNFGRTVAFLWGPTPSLSRLIFVVQLFLGFLAAWRFLSPFSPDIPVIIWVGAMLFATAAFGSLLTIPMLWLLSVGTKWVTGVYVASLCKTFVHLAPEELLKV